MNDNADRRLDALFAAARTQSRDTSRQEWGFETRLAARLREEASPFAAVVTWAWKLCPFFAALAVAASLWSRMPAVRAEADAHLLVEVSRSNEEQTLLAYLTGDRE